MSDEQESRLFSALRRESSGGRPRIMPSERDRDKVRLLVAIGWKGEEIAAAMGISRRQLYRTFGTEMVDARVMRLRLDTEILIAVAEEAIRNGRPSSIRMFVALLKDAVAARIEARSRNDDAPRREAPEKPGKKAAAIAAAELTISTRDDDWGDNLNPHAVN